jgi:electron transport complex protein RnfG
MKSPLRNASRNALVLGAFALLGTALMAGSFLVTRAPIAASETAEKQALLNQVMPASHYDNDLLASVRTLPANAQLGTRAPSRVWRAERRGKPVGVILEVIAPDGYSGDIFLLIGVDINGRLTGVRVTAHRETPGLGDYIEKRKSPWIDQFAGRALGQPATGEWAVRKDGGAFDARAGATVTPRAVVAAIRRALEYVQTHHDTLYPTTP